jgi:hypothetical protein
LRNNVHFFSHSTSHDSRIGCLERSAGA